MADFPYLPLPSHISAPEVIDPMVRQTQDMGYEVRRSLHSRPRFRYTVEWLGQQTHGMRAIRDFLMQMRLGMQSFRWFHTTALEDGVQVYPTTPITLVYPFGHGLFTGMWIVAANGVGVSTAIHNAWQVTYIDRLTVTLRGSTALGTGTVSTYIFFPRAVARFAEDTWASPVKLIGPESMANGFWNFQVQIEEVF